MITVFKDIFKNQPHCWIHPCALALFCFISFGVFNVTQRGIMEKGNLKAPPPPAGRPGRVRLLGRGPNPVCSSVAQKMHLQLCRVERKITACFFPFYLGFNQRPLSLPLILPLSHCMVAFGSEFHISWFSG